MAKIYERLLSTNILGEKRSTRLFAGNTASDSFFIFFLHD